MFNEFHVRKMRFMENVFRVVCKIKSSIVSFVRKHKIDIRFIFQ